MRKVSPGKRVVSVGASEHQNVKLSTEVTKNSFDRGKRDVSHWLPYIALVILAVTFCVRLGPPYQWKNYQMHEPNNK